MSYNFVMPAEKLNPVHHFAITPADDPNLRHRYLFIEPPVAAEILTEVELESGVAVLDAATEEGMSTLIARPNEVRTPTDELYQKIKNVVERSGLVIQTFPGLELNPSWLDWRKYIKNRDND